jgi:site-specific DNA recombinase
MGVVVRNIIGERSSEAGLRACSYARVSTTRQAEGELSLPEQDHAIEKHCDSRNWKLVARYVDAGVSGREDDRAEFQRMIERACDDDHPFDLIVVHSYSRFFRDAFGLEMYVRQLAKVGVRLVSITQELGDDPAQVMMRQMIAMFDEYQSRENAKHVLRAMKENARQGFYNGSPLPLGYTTQEIEKRGARVKKKLVVDPVEAETVRLIFRLYRLGDGKSGPLGIKAIASWLNEHGHRTRSGGRFGVGALHKILTNAVYIGTWTFNRRCAKTQRVKPENEHVAVGVPPIIDVGEFEAVAAALKSRDPRVAAPRVVTGPILLTGLAVCASCGGGMTLRTGTSRSGAVHKYYSCSTCVRQGKTGCKGRSIPMAKLDSLVTDHLVERLFHPERLTAILASVAARRAERALEVDERIAALQTEVTEAKEKLKRLYKMVEDGITDLDDILKERVAGLKLDRDRAGTALERIKARSAAPAAFDSEAIERFGRAMRENLASGDIPFRKAYIQSVVDRIEVDDGVIRIIGDKDTLEQAVAGRVVAAGRVRRCIPKWRAQGDSNPCFRRERATS